MGWLKRVSSREHGRCGASLTAQEGMRALLSLRSEHFADFLILFCCWIRAPVIDSLAYAQCRWRPAPRAMLSCCRAPRRAARTSFFFEWTYTPSSSPSLYRFTGLLLASNKDAQPERLFALGCH